MIRDTLFQPLTCDRRPQHLDVVRRKCCRSVSPAIDARLMLYLGVMIGTGLLYQSGQLLALAGPVSLLLAYLIMGTVVYAVQVGKVYNEC